MKTRLDNWQQREKRGIEASFIAFEPRMRTTTGSPTKGEENAHHCTQYRTIVRDEMDGMK